MAMPTASIRRETSPQFFQNRIPLMLLMVAPRILVAGYLTCVVL
jgi:hypothetical protein